MAALRERYAEFSKKLKQLISAIESNHHAMTQLSSSRLEVAKAIHTLSQDTPLYKSAGELLTDGSDSTSSYAAVHTTLNKKSQLYLNKYPEHILNYAIEWERILTARITDGLKQSEKLRVDLDHYQNKVEDLSKGTNKAMNKGKNVNDKDIEKLKRNEAKFVQARQDYDKFVNDLCGYMEEVLDRSWRDLHPMLVKMTQFDSTFSDDQANILKRINGVTHELMAFGTKNDLMPQGRLKELESSSPEALVQKYHPSGTTLTIMGGEVGGGLVPPTGGDGLPVGGGGLFSTIPRKNSNENFAGSLQSSRSNSEVSALRSRTNTGDSDWSKGCGPTPTDFSLYSSSAAPAPAPTLDEIFGGGANNNAGEPQVIFPAGIPLPPPSAPPPLPPQQMPNIVGLSMYGQMPLSMASPPVPFSFSHNQVSGGPNSSGLFSPGNMSQGTIMSTGDGSTNPFDDAPQSLANPLG